MDPIKSSFQLCNFESAFNSLTNVADSFQNMIDIRTSAMSDLQKAFEPITNQIQSLQDALSAISPTIQGIDTSQFFFNSTKLGEELCKCFDTQFDAFYEIRNSLNAVNQISELGYAISENFSITSSVFESLQRGICDMIRENMFNVGKSLSLLHSNIASLQIHDYFDFTFSGNVPYRIRNDTDTIQSQAPPSLIETAIENAKFNVKKLQSSKPYKFIKKHSLALMKSIIYKIVSDFLLKLLGM